MPSLSEWREAKSQKCEHSFKPLRTVKLRILQDARGGGPGRPDVMFVQEIKVYEEEPE